MHCGPVGSGKLYLVEKVARTKGWEYHIIDRSQGGIDDLQCRREVHDINFPPPGSGEFKVTGFTGDLRVSALDVLPMF